MLCTEDHPIDAPRGRAGRAERADAGARSAGVRNLRDAELGLAHDRTDLLRRGDAGPHPALHSARPEDRTFRQTRSTLRIRAQIRLRRRVLTRRRILQTPVVLPMAAQRAGHHAIVRRSHQGPRIAFLRKWHCRCPSGWTRPRGSRLAVPTLTHPSAPNESGGEAGMDGALGQVSALLSGYLSAKAADAGHPELARLARLLAGFVTGGKGLRPQLCVAGWLAAGGGSPGLVPGPDTDAVIHAATSLELFHAFALIQDDVMDGSATRRGRPAMHCALAAGYPGGDTNREARRFGINGAILLGDLALVWSDEILAAAPLSAAQREAAGPVIRMLRAAAIFGQYLALLAPGRQDADVDATLTVAQYKTGSYTVHRPLQLGAALAGADPEVLRDCRAVGAPLGEAIPLCGDPARTGKSRLDDLREG